MKTSPLPAVEPINFQPSHLVPRVWNFDSIHSRRNRLVHIIHSGHCLFLDSKAAILMPVCRSMLLEQSMIDSDSGSALHSSTELPADSAVAPGAIRRCFLKRASFEGGGDDTEMPDVSSTPPAVSSPVSDSVEGQLELGCL